MVGTPGWTISLANLSAAKEKRAYIEEETRDSTHPLKDK
jgi:hypothetical protein